MKEAICEKTVDTTTIETWSVSPKYLFAIDKCAQPRPLEKPRSLVTVNWTDAIAIVLQTGMEQLTFGENLASISRTSVVLALIVEDYGGNDLEECRLNHAS